MLFLENDFRSNTIRTTIKSPLVLIYTVFLLYFRPKQQGKKITKNLPANGLFVHNNNIQFWIIIQQQQQQKRKKKTLTTTNAHVKSSRALCYIVHVIYACHYIWSSILSALHLLHELYKCFLICTIMLVSTVYIVVNVYRKKIVCVCALCTFYCLYYWFIINICALRRWGWRVPGACAGPWVKHDSRDEKRFYIFIMDRWCGVC